MGLGPDRVLTDPRMVPEGRNSLTVINNTLYFVANDGVHDIELWALDTTTTPSGTWSVGVLKKGAASWSDMGRLDTGDLANVLGQSAA